MGLEGIVFEALQSVDGNRMPIYHTNVMMAIGTGWAAVCLDGVDHPEDKLLRSLSRVRRIDHRDALGRPNQPIRWQHARSANISGEKLVVMSQRAFDALTEGQRETGQFGTLVPNRLDTIELCGGGSARCMMAVHLPFESQPQL